MRLRPIAIFAAAALAVAGGLFLLTRGGGESSAAPVAAEVASTLVPAPRKVDPPPSDRQTGGSARLTASHGPYGDPFEAPAGVATGPSPAAGNRVQMASRQAIPPSLPAARPSTPAPSSSSPAGVIDTGSPGPRAGGPAGSPSPSGPPESRSPSDPGAGAPAVKPSVTPSASHEHPAATLRLVIPGQTPRMVTLGPEGVLPSRANPLLAVLRVAPHRKRAVLMPATDVRPEGQSRCAPSADRCRRLTLTVGQIQLLEATSKAGRPVRYRLRLINVR